MTTTQLVLLIALVTTITIFVTFGGFILFARWSARETVERRRRSHDDR